MLKLISENTHCRGQRGHRDGNTWESKQSDGITVFKKKCITVNIHHLSHLSWSRQTHTHTHTHTHRHTHTHTHTHTHINTLTSQHSCLPIVIQPMAILCKSICSIQSQRRVLWGTCFPQMDCLISSWAEWWKQWFGAERRKATYTPITKSIVHLPFTVMGEGLKEKQDWGRTDFTRLQHHLNFANVNSEFFAVASSTCI